VAVLAVVFNAALAGLLVMSSIREPTVPDVPQESLAAAPVDPAPAPVAPAQPMPAAVPPPVPAAPPPEELPIRATPPATPLPALPLMTDAELQQQARALADEFEAPADPAPERSEPTAAAKPAEVQDDTPLERIPLLVELPVEHQQTLRQMRIDVHVFAAAPGDRFVMINLRKFREGDDVSPELYLERITREGMVMVYRGQRFRWLMSTG
jgi:general secretion pathway protein B